MIKQLHEMRLTIPMDQIEDGWHRLASGIEEMPVTW